MPPGGQRKQVLEEEAVAGWELGPPCCSGSGSISTPAFESIPLPLSRKPSTFSRGNRWTQERESPHRAAPWLLADSLAGFPPAAASLWPVPLPANKDGAPADPALSSSLLRSVSCRAEKQRRNEGGNQGKAASSRSCARPRWAAAIGSGRAWRDLVGFTILVSESFGHKAGAFRLAKSRSQCPDGQHPGGGENYPKRLS